MVVRSPKATPAHSFASRAYRRYCLVLIAPIVLLVTAVIALAITTAGGGFHTDPEVAGARQMLFGKIHLGNTGTGKRILFVGGSGTQASFLAADASRAFGRTTLNLGTHAGLGFAVLAHLVEETARPGDIVVMPIEYETYATPPLNSLSVNLDHDRALGLRDGLGLVGLIRYLQNLDLADIGSGLIVSLARASAGAGDDGREFGDTPPRDSDPSVLGRAIPRHPVLSPLSANHFEANAELLERLVAWAGARDVSLIVTDPPLMAETAVADGLLEGRAGVLLHAGAEMVQLPNSGRFRAEGVFDTAYHANTNGAAVYTASVVSALCSGPLSNHGVACNEREVERITARAHGVDDLGLILNAKALGPVERDQSGQPFRRPEGGEVTFVVAAPDCANWLRIRTANAGRPVRIAIAIDGIAKDEVEISRSDAPLDIALGPGGPIRRITLRLSGWQDVRFQMLRRECAALDGGAS